MLGMIGMCLVNCNQAWAVALLCISVASNGAVFSGYICSFMDMAPNFAGTLKGISSTFASMPGFLAPIVVGAITQDNVSLAISGDKTVQREQFHYSDKRFSTLLILWL